MGFIIDSTPEMGEYGAEIRRESFYLHGADAYDFVYNNKPRPRHALVVYPVKRPLHGPTPLDIEERERLEWIVTKGNPTDPVVRKATAALLADGRAWRSRAEEERERVTNAGTVEFLIEDIPKIRAVFNYVEGFTAQNGD